MTIPSLIYKTETEHQRKKVTPVLDIPITTPKHWIGTGFKVQHCSIPILKYSHIQVAIVVLFQIHNIYRMLRPLSCNSRSDCLFSTTRWMTSVLSMCFHVWTNWNISKRIYLQTRILRHKLSLSTMQLWWQNWYLRFKIWGLRWSRNGWMKNDRVGVIPTDCFRNF